MKVTHTSTRRTDIGFAGTVIDLGHEGPTVLRTNNTQTRCPALVTR